MKLYTTLNEIKSFCPCKDGWWKLLNGLGKTKADDEPLDYSDILRINGADDTIWSLRTNEGVAVAFAVFCAESVIHLYDGDSLAPKEAILSAKNWILNPSNQTAYAAHAAAYAAASRASGAAHAAAYAAYAAAHAAAYAADKCVVNFLVDFLRGGRNE